MADSKYLLIVRQIKGIATQAMAPEDMQFLFTYYVLPIGCVITYIVRCIYDFVLR